MGYTEEQQFLYDVLTTAVEGGIGYWSQAKKVVRDSDLNVLEIEVADAEDEYPAWHVVTPKGIKEAINKILHGQVKIATSIAAQFIGFPGNIEQCNYDAAGADCAVQIAAFGEIVFS